jgi:SOS-response transcriptional repressor LexA
MSEPMNTQAMPPETARLFEILQRHKGRANAISMRILYTTWNEAPVGIVFGSIVYGSTSVARDQIATLSRHMRRLIDDLRDIYSVPVMSSAQAGYWIAADEAEVKEVCREFRARGLKSLTTSARLARISLSQEVEQLALDLRAGKPTQ